MAYFKIAGLILIILIILILSLPKLLNLVAKDINAINDSDLELQKVFVLDNDNAYFDLVKIDSVVYEPKEKLQLILEMIGGKAWDNQFAKELISKNTRAFEYFNQAVHKPKYQNPNVADPKNINLNTALPKLSSWKKIVRLSSIKALYLAKQGKDKEAIEEALKSLNIAQKIQESQPTLFEYILATSMKNSGLLTLQKIISSSKLTSRELKQYIQELEKFYKNEEGLIAAFKVEYNYLIETVDSIRNESNELNEIFGEEKIKDYEITKKIKNNYYFQPNKTKLLLAEYIRNNIKNISQSCERIDIIEKKPLVTKNPIKLYLEENLVGKVLYDTLSINLANLIIEKCYEDLLLGITQIMIAIKAFKNDNNDYPPSLEVLIPNYLSSIPQDPFDGKMIKYSAKEKIIYSAGKSFKGSDSDNEEMVKKIKSPIFKIEF